MPAPSFFMKISILLLILLTDHMNTILSSTTQPSHQQTSTTQPPHQQTSTTQSTYSKSKRASDQSVTRNLFRGYEKLPPPNVQTKVQLGIYINYFYAISEQSMDYRLSFYLRQNWTDHRLNYTNPGKGRTRLKLEHSQTKRLWTPDVFFRNEKTAGYHFVTQSNSLCYIENGQVWYVSKITARLACPMKLQKYPMDMQFCPLQLESFGYTTETLLLQWIMPAEKAVEFDKTGQEQPEVEIDTNVLLDDCTYNDTSGFSDRQIPCIQVKFPVYRPMGYYIIQFYIPSVLLVMLSWVSFWISVDAVVARVNIGLMTVLNLVTQSAGSRGQLPKVSYVKAIDVWMTGCLVFAFASLIEFAIVNVWSRIEEDIKKKQYQLLQLQIQKQLIIQQQLLQQQQLQQQQYHQQKQQVQHRVSSKKDKLPSKNSSKKPNIPAPITIQVDEEWMGVQPALEMDEKIKWWRWKRLRLLPKYFSRDETRATRLDQLSRWAFPCTFVLFNAVYWFSYMS